MIPRGPGLASLQPPPLISTTLSPCLQEEPLPRLPLGHPGPSAAGARPRSAGGREPRRPGYSNGAFLQAFQRAQCFSMPLPAGPLVASPAPLQSPPAGDGAINATNTTAIEPAWSGWLGRSTPQSTMGICPCPGYIQVGAWGAAASYSAQAERAPAPGLGLEALAARRSGAHLLPPAGNPTKAACLACASPVPAELLDLV